MFKDFENSFNQFEQNMRNKVYEMKYSREYLDLKDDLKSAGRKAKHIYQTDLKSAANNLKDLTKKAFKKKGFQQLISVKS